MRNDATCDAIGSSQNPEQPRLLAALPGDVAVIGAEIPVADRDRAPLRAPLAVHDTEPLEVRFDRQLGVGDAARFVLGRVAVPRHARQRHQPSRD